MDAHKKSVAQICLAGAEGNTMTFPQIVGMLMQEGFESYMVDFRQAIVTYYMPDGESIELSADWIDGPVASTFDAGRIQEAIKEAQQLVPGYTYKGFCKKVASAGCANYIVSFSGRRVLYIGRTAEIHTEHFPS